MYSDLRGLALVPLRKDEGLHRCASGATPGRRATGNGRIAVDLGLARPDPCEMDDDIFPSKPDDPLVLLARQDLDPLSQEELEVRIAALRAEIGRVEAHMAAVARHRSAADALFKR